MLLLLIKSFLISGFCYLALFMLKKNCADLKQKIILISLTTCLLLPFITQLPVSFNVNKLSTNKTSLSTSIEAPLESNIVKTNISKPVEYVVPVNISNINTVKFSDSLYSLLLLIWVTGFTFKAIKFAIQFIAIKRLIQSSDCLERSYLTYKFKNKVINYNVSALTSVPFLFTNKATIEIILPKQALSWDQSTLSTVIKHEMCHYRRKDHLAIWFAEVVTWIYWFHPLIVSLVKKHKELIEFACDDQLLYEGIDSQNYAKTILNLPAVENLNSIVANMANKPYLLKTRIYQILQNQRIKLSHTKTIYLAFIATSTFLVSCVNNNTLLSVNGLINLVSNDLPSFRSGNLEEGNIHLAIFYDGAQNDSAYIEFEIIQKGTSNSQWLKLGPLKKFTQQIQTWHFQTTKKGLFTGNYKISGVQADGVVDGVAVGFYYTGNDGNTKIHKSQGPIENGTPNVVCSWPLNLKDTKINATTPQLTQYNAESIKRLLCGSQLLNNGSYSIN